MENKSTLKTTWPPGQKQEGKNFLYLLCFLKANKGTAQNKGAAAKEKKSIKLLGSQRLFSTIEI